MIEACFLGRFLEAPDLPEASETETATQATQATLEEATHSCTKNRALEASTTTSALGNARFSFQDVSFFSSLRSFWRMFAVRFKNLAESVWTVWTCSMSFLIQVSICTNDVFSCVLIFGHSVSHIDKSKVVIDLPQYIHDLRGCGRIRHELWDCIESLVGLSRIFASRREIYLCIPAVCSAKEVAQGPLVLWLSETFHLQKRLHADPSTDFFGTRMPPF